MPVLFKMSDDKKTEDTPTVVFAETTVAPPRKTKKYVIIAVSGILAAVIILAAILVGMYMFTEAQKDIIKYTMQLNQNSKQDVTSDPNENVVQYHVSNPSHDAYIINDFNRDIQVTKVINDGRTTCYVSALNRSNAMDPSKITGPDTAPPTSVLSLMYRVSDTPIVDTSFLGKTARDTCKGISVYWLYPYCSDGIASKAMNETNIDHPMRKRQTTKNSPPYYCQNSIVVRSTYDGQYYNIPCVTGCCQTVCAWHIDYSAKIVNGQMQCSWNIQNNPPTFTNNPIAYDSSCSGPQGISCPNANHACYCP